MGPVCHINQAGLPDIILDLTNSLPAGLKVYMSNISDKNNPRKHAIRARCTSSNVFNGIDKTNKSNITNKSEHP